VLASAFGFMALVLMGGMVKAEAKALGQRDPRAGQRPVWRDGIT
jgi:hypothetical protein